MANTRLTCVIRKGLDMPTGLFGAQSLHIGDGWMRKRILEGQQFSEIEKEWMQEPYVTVLAVNTLEELNEVYKKAVALELPVCRWEDLVYSKLLNAKIRMMVGFSIGPEDFDKIQEATSNLPLY